MANDAGTAYIDVEPDLKGFGSKLGRGIDPHVDRSAKNVQSKFSGAFASVAKVAGGVFAAKLGVDLFKDVIGGASDLSETISKSNTIFGANAKEIEAWAGTAAKSMGQSKQGALDAAATFGNLFVQLGTGSGEAAKMSKEMVGLASDFASFHNADPTDVIESMTAAFRGEYDAVQRYVPTINAAAVEQEALKLGLAGSTKELTAQDKALATQSLLMKGAGDAMGDFARTSDGLANRQRILSAQFQDVKDKIGTALLPVVLRLMEGFLGLGKVVGPIASKVGEFIKNAFAPGKADVTWLDSLVGGVRALIGAFKNAEDGITSSGFAGKMEQIGIAARRVFDFIKDNAKPILIGLGAALVALFAPFTGTIALLVLAYNRFEGFREVVNLVVKTAIEQFGNLVNWFKSVWPQITEAVGHVVAVIQKLWRTFGDEIVAVARSMWDQIRNVVQTAIDVVRGIIQTVLALINGDWGKAWDGIKGILGAVWEFIRETVVNGLRLVREVIEAGLDVVRGIFQRAWDGIKGIVAGAFGWILDKFLGFVESFLGLAAKAFSWLPPVKNKLEEAKGWVAGFRDDVNAYIDGIQGEITITADTSQFWAELGAARSAAQRGVAIETSSREGGGEGVDTAGVQKFARGLFAGPVLGHPGEEVPIIAHAGEWVLTEEQLSDLKSGRSGGSTAPAGAAIDYDLLAGAVARAMASEPMHAEVLSSELARGLHAKRRR